MTLSRRMGILLGDHCGETGRGTLGEYWYNPYPIYSYPTYMTP